MKQILFYMKKFKSSAIASIILTVFNNGMQLLLPAMMSLIINNGISSSVTDGGGVEYIKKIGSYMVIASLGALIIAAFSSYFSSKASTGFAKELRRAVFTKIESLTESDIDKISTSSLITRSTNDVRQIENMVLNCIRMLMSSLIMLVGGTVMAFSLNKTLAAVLFTVVPVILILAMLIMKKIIPMYDIVQKFTDKLNQVLREKISGIRVIRSFNKTEHEDKRFKSANDSLTHYMLKINRIYALLIPVGSLLLIGVIVLLVFLNVKQIETADLSIPSSLAMVTNTIGNLQAFIIYALLIIASITMAASMYVFIPKAMISVNRIVEVLNIEPAVKDSLNENIPNLTNIIEFKNVDFSYPCSDANILENISFSAMPGEVTAIIGGTGSGKSSIVNLIPRFYDVKNGEITIGNVNIKDIPQKNLREKIALIPQKAVLFSGTIADNLRFGKEDATEEEMWEALRIAEAEDFVKKMPDKLDSFVSQGGKNLSGGQKQRLSIARAIIKKADIYIFDDSFSALDFKTDAALRRSLRKELKNSILIIVAQRIGTIIDADKIIVLSDGKAIGIGTHAELSKNCEEYIEIMHSQLAKEDLA